MQQPVISAPDKKDLDKFTKFLCLKGAQVIVQGRLGKTISSHCSPLPTGAEWFNLAIKDYPEIQKEAKSALVDGNPNIRSSFVIEISLRTSDSESLTLEVWSLSVLKKYEDVRIHHTVYNRMSLLLKSLMCVSRATPAYKLSRKQGSEYVICFRVYTGKANITGLGEGFKTLRVGSIGTPTGTLTLSVAFRTTENLHVSTKRLASEMSGPMKVSPDHFCSPKSTIMSPARPCHTLQSRLMSSRELSSGSQSSSGPPESPSYGFLPTSFSTSPNELFMESSLRKGAVFTIGTPPTSSSLVKTPPSQSPSPLLPRMQRRILSDVTPHRDARNTRSRKTRPFTYSLSEQNFSDPMQYLETRGRRRQTIQEAAFYSQSKDSSTTASSSMRSTLKSEENVFKPISYSPSEEKQTSASYKTDNNIAIVVSPEFDGNKRKIYANAVMALKSNSPTNARVGFPDNTKTTSHLSHIPPSQTDSSASERSHQNQLYMPSTGAFVSNSKTAKRAYNTLSEVSNDQRLPFDDLISEGGSSTTGLVKNEYKGALRNSSSDTSPESGKENSSTITRISSQSSLSSHPSSDSSPRKNDLSPSHLADEFLMIDLNPAFGRSDSAKDLGAFYREIENAPDLLMFQENNGEETHETLLDLTKQLEDYKRDAEGFDEFIKELAAVP